MLATRSGVPNLRFQERLDDGGYSGTADVNLDLANGGSDTSSLRIGRPALPVRW